MVFAAPDISVVIPVFRNVETIEALYARLCTTLESSGLSFELIFVNDACPMNSQAVLEQLASKDERITVIELSKNIGQHKTSLVGLAHATANQVTALDADLQDPPEALPMLIKGLESGYDVVFAGRRGKYQSGQRLLSSRIFKKLLRLLTGIPLDAGTYWVARRSVIDTILHWQVARPHLVTLLGISGARLLSIPVERSSSPTGASGYTNWMRLKLGLEAIFLALQWRLGLISFQPEFPLDKCPIKTRIGHRFL
ncbi:MAG: glycosyltransferase family 2 protein [Chloroflexota bacterium]